MDYTIEDLKADIRAEEYFDMRSEASVLEKEAHDRGFASVEDMQIWERESYLQYRDLENA